MNQKKQTCGFIRIDICYFWDRFFLLLARATLRTSVRSRYSVASCGSGVDRGVPNAGTWSLVVRPGGAAGVPPLSGGETPARDRVHIFRLFRVTRSIGAGAARPSLECRFRFASFTLIQQITDPSELFHYEGLLNAFTLVRNFPPLNSEDKTIYRGLTIFISFLIDICFTYLLSTILEYPLFLKSMHR